MLVLTRTPDESIVIDDDIRITVLRVRGNDVRLGIEAPGHPVHRSEVYARLLAERRTGEGSQTETETETETEETDDSGTDSINVAETLEKAEQDCEGETEAKDFSQCDSVCEAGDAEDQHGQETQRCDV